MRENTLISAISLIIYLYFSPILFVSCLSYKYRDQKKKNIDIELYIKEYWNKDSLSTNGFKDLISMEIINNKKIILGKDEEYLITLLGYPRRRIENENNVTFFYRVIDSQIRGDDTYLVLIIDKNKKNVINLYRFKEDG